MFQRTTRKQFWKPRWKLLHRRLKKLRSMSENVLKKFECAVDHTRNRNFFQILTLVKTCFLRKIVLVSKLQWNFFWNVSFPATSRFWESREKFQILKFSNFDDICVSKSYASFFKPCVLFIIQLQYMTHRRCSKGLTTCLISIFKFWAPSSVGCILLIWLEWVFVRFSGTEQVYVKATE